MLLLLYNFCPFGRCLFGLGDAASYSAVLGVTMSLFPSKAATLLGSCETTFGAGYTIGNYAHTQIEKTKIVLKPLFL